MHAVEFDIILAEKPITPRPRVIHPNGLDPKASRAPAANKISIPVAVWATQSHKYNLSDAPTGSVGLQKWISAIALVNSYGFFCFSYKNTNRMPAAIIPARVMNHSRAELIFLILFKKNNNIIGPKKIRNTDVYLFITF